MKSKILKHIWRPTLYDSFTFIFICLSLAASLYFLRKNISQGPVSPKGERIGFLIIKRNITQRKLLDQVVWEDVKEQHIPLYNKDTVRTGENSSALLRLNDKTEIDLDEDTLLFMDIIDKSTNINFARGSIRVKADENNKDSKKIKVHSKNHVISLEKASLNIKASKDDDKLDVLVNKGKAAILSGEGEKYDVDKNEELSFDEGEAKFRKIPVSLISPPNSYRFSFNKGTKNTKIEQKFEWNFEKDARIEFFELSRTSNFSSLLVKRSLRGSRGLRIKLGEGNYYWRLRFFSIGIRGPQYTSTFKFSLIANNVFLRGFASQKKEVFSEEALRRPPVSFSWNLIPSANNYFLDISRDSDFSKVLTNRTTSQLGLRLGLPPGQYYWRVRAKTAFEGQAIESRIYSLNVDQPEKKEAPSLLSFLHSKGDKTSSSSLAKAPAKRALPKTLDLKNLSLGSEKEKQVPKAKAKPEAEAKPKAKAKPELEAKPKAKAKPEPKPKPKPVKKIKNVAKPILSSPKNNAAVHSVILRKKGLRFRWTIDSRLDGAELLIAKEESFAAIVHRENIPSSKNEVMIRAPLEAGLYYWKIIGLKDAKQKGPASQLYAFVVEEKIKEIILKEPKDGDFIPVEKDEITFVWEGLEEDLEYEFSLARDPRFRRALKKASTKNTSIKIPSPKKSKRYYWKVRALYEGEEFAKSKANKLGLTKHNSYIELRNGKKVRGHIVKMTREEVQIMTSKGLLKYNMDEINDVSQ